MLLFLKATDNEISGYPSIQHFTSAQKQTCIARLHARGNACCHGGHSADDGSGCARSLMWAGRFKRVAGITQLTSELRDVTTRLHSDLKQCTVRISATGDLASDQNGYFLYYEGPLTDATSSLFRIDTSSGQPVFPDSRYGDCDDYLAFTAVAKPGQWFKGKVPRYLILQKEREVFRQSLTDPTLDLDPIYSLRTQTILPMIPL